jgi:hypothetical protein
MGGKGSAKKDVIETTGPPEIIGGDEISMK